MAKIGLVIVDHGGIADSAARAAAAAALWWAVTERRGVSGRDAIWAHPDLLPTAEDLDDPIGFAEPPDDSDPLSELGPDDKLGDDAS